VDCEKFKSVLTLQRILVRSILLHSLLPLLFYLGYKTRQRRAIRPKWLCLVREFWHHTQSGPGPGCEFMGTCVDEIWPHVMHVCARALLLFL